MTAIVKIGGVIWVSVSVLSDFFFGNVPFVRENLPIFLLGIVILSAVPALLEVGRDRGVVGKKNNIAT